MYASDYELLSPWLQTGFTYACAARRDGAAAWVVAEVVDRYLRFADACGGAHWFHTACLLQWCEVENTCPTCRQFFNYICPRGAHRIYVVDRVQEGA